MQLTTEQQSIIDSIVTQFYILNMPKSIGHKYFNADGIKDVHLDSTNQAKKFGAIVSAKAMAQSILAHNYFDDLMNDLSSLGLRTWYSDLSPYNCTMSIVRGKGETILLEIRGIETYGYLPNGERIIQDIETAYRMVRLHDNTEFRFDSFKELVSSNVFKSEIINLTK